MTTISRVSGFICQVPGANTMGIPFIIEVGYVTAIKYLLGIFLRKLIFFGNIINILHSKYQNPRVIAFNHIISPFYLPAIDRHLRTIENISQSQYNSGYEFQNA